MEDFTIVIATAVRPSLIDTLKSIKDSKLLPKEVIISIPTGKALNLRSKFNFRIKTIAKAKGQVKQRIEGFKKVKTNLCIQMDDDITFDENFLSLFINSFKKLPCNSVLSPMNSINNKTLSVLVYPKPFFSNIIYYILDSTFNPPYGRITKAGFPVGVNPIYDSRTEEALVQSQWINGCCAIHNSSNLILNFEYPFKGKAFSEDIIQSQFLTENNILLFIDRSLTISLKEEDSNFNLYTYFKAKLDSFKAISSFKKVKSNLLRYLIFSLFFVFSKILSSLNNKLFKCKN